MLVVRPIGAVLLPRALEASAERYGSIGVAFTYLAWLYVVAFTFLVAATVGHVIATDEGRFGGLVRGIQVVTTDDRTGPDVLGPRGLPLQGDSPVRRLSDRERRPIPRGGAMSQTGTSPNSPSPTVASTRAAPPEPTGWVGLVAFAAFLMIMAGCFHAIAGFVALFKEEYYVVPGADLVVGVDYTTWGWIHVLLGILVVAGGAGLLNGRTWARTLAVVLALVSAVVNFAFFAAYPWWSALIILLDVLVIYALVAHGRELQRHSDAR